MAQHDITQALLDIDIPTSFCHIPDDRIVTIDNLPSNSDMSANANLEMYDPPLAFLRPTGNHFTGPVACAIDPILSCRITNLNHPLPNPRAPRVCYAGTHHNGPTFGALQSINDDSSAISVVIGRNGLLLSLVGLVLATVALSIMLV
jgi:hypothetical protein